MNVPNQLTVARFGLTVVFLAILFSEIAFYQSWAVHLHGGKLDRLFGR